MEEIDRPHGWTLTEALSELQVEVFRFAFAASAKAGYEPDHCRQVAWEGIAPQLERANLHATGVPTGGTAPQAIHPSFAAAAKPDFEANRLHLNGTAYAGVRLWRGANVVATPVRTDKTHLANTAEADCVKWLIQSWPASPGVRKPDWREKAKQFALSETAFNRAWATAAKDHAGMVAPGAPKKIPR